MRNLLVLPLGLSILTSLAVPPPASAQGRGDSSSEVEVMDFLDGDLVTGDLVGPLGELVGARTRRARQSLIRPRAHFQQEMLKSVENL